MGFFNWLMEPSPYEKEQAKRNNRSIFDAYSSPEDYAADHREDHDSWEEAIDAWEENRRKKNKR